MTTKPPAESEQLTDERLRSLLATTEQLAGPFRSALHEVTWRQEFRERFDAPTCADLIKEVLTLRQSVRECLEGLGRPNDGVDVENGLCWCPGPDWPAEHSEACQAAQELYERLKIQ